MKDSGFDMDELLKKQALLMAANCVRLTVIEDYHAAYNITDEDMKAFNKEVANKLYTFMKLSADPDRSGDFLSIMRLYYPSNWDLPELDKDFCDALDKGVSGDQVFQMLKDAKK